MAREIRALRGATTLEADNLKNISERVGELLDLMVVENSVPTEDVVSVFFSGTPDISSTFPATAGREVCNWLEDVALFGSQELEVASGPPLCVRILIQFYTQDLKNPLKHIYLHGAKILRKNGGQDSSVDSR